LENRFLPAYVIAVNRERKAGAVLKPYGMGSQPAISVRAGTTEEWIIENWTNELHAFHSKEGPVRPERVRIKLSFPESLAGDIPFHCHLVDHEDNGMMEALRVLPSGHQAAPRASIATRSILPP
jgi:FtsP/CotA-like multicopper oxidase with cupredoxin domain